MDSTIQAPEEVAAVLERARAAAIDYYKLTGKPLGITGEIGEYEVARLLGLKLAAPRKAGYDAIDSAGRRYQIKARCINENGLRKSQRLGSIKLTHAWDAVLLVILARISHTAECIGAANQRKPLCCNNFRRRAERPDADRVSPGFVWI